MRSKYEVVLIDEELADQYRPYCAEGVSLIGLYAVVDFKSYFRLFEQEADAIAQKEALDETTYVYVNTYFVQRLKGGSEEGGWWYAAGEPVESVWYVNRRVAETEFPIVEAKWNYQNEQEGNRELGSVLSRGQYHVRIEYEFATPYPANKPRYE